MALPPYNPNWDLPPPNFPPDENAHPFPPNDLPPLPPNDLPPLYVEPDAQVEAGVVPVGRNAVPDADGIINLDTNHASKEPSQVILKEVAAKLGCTVADLATKNFRLQKGFQAEKNSNQPIPVYAYSNPPGPDCYYFVRHWRVTVTNDQGQDEEMHFSKKIYTSVEVPRTLDGAAQKQQQYVAALAARTYAKIEESRMIVGAGGQSDLYDSIGPQMSKIARDRFVTLEMFNNANKVAINPLKTKDIKNVTVDQIRLHIRAAKAGVEGELEHEGYKSISLTPNGDPDTAIRLKKKIYEFEPGNTPSSHVRKVAAVLKTDDVLYNIRHNDMTPEQAFADADLTVAEARISKDGLIKDKVQSFYNQSKYFSDSSSVKHLMRSHAPNSYELSDAMMNQIAPEKSLAKRILNKNPKDFAALEKLVDLIENKTPTGPQREQARMMLEATRNVHEAMKKDHAELLELEQDLVDMGITGGVDPNATAARQAMLDKMAGFIATLDAAGLPAVPDRPIQQGPVQQNPNPDLNVNPEWDNLDDLDGGESI